jgi:hypothetical protein
MSRLIQLRFSRQAWFCAGMIVLGIVLTAGANPNIRAQAADCVPHESCPCHETAGCQIRVKTPTCCNPPPCEIYRELVHMRAYRNASRSSFHQVPIAMAKLEDASVAALQQYRDKRNEEYSKELDKYSMCPYEYRVPKALAARDTGNSCEIGLLMVSDSKFQPISLQQAKQDPLVCAELVDAEYAQAMQDQYFCDQLTKAPKTDLGTWLKQERRRATAKINSLEGALLEYVNLCSFTFEAKLAREVADRGIEALIDRALPKPPPKKAKPKKSGKKKGKQSRSG